MDKNEIDLEEFVNLAGRVFQRHLDTMGINEKINIITPEVSLDTNIIGDILTLGAYTKAGYDFITTTTPYNVYEKIGMSLIEYIMKDFPMLDGGSSNTRIYINSNNLETLKSLVELSNEEYILWLKLA